ncbi:MAG: hypothetical protein QNJ55_02005 [Xenococcus sp. MO_188.B8]|nr:hypothetical protein [Xenococcus sp. MO_188.B8]
MKLTKEQEFEKEILKRCLENNPEQASKIVAELFDKLIQERQEQKKLESQYDELLQKYIILRDAYIANLKLINRNQVRTALTKIIQLPNFI